MGEVGSIFQAVEVEEFGGKKVSHREPKESEKSSPAARDKRFTGGKNKDFVERAGKVIKREKREMIDDVLVRRFVDNRDDSAFVELLRRHEGYINRILYILFRGEREDIEDAKQEVFIELYRKLRRFRFESQVKTFLYSIVRNRAIDIIRKRERERKKLIHFVSVGQMDKTDCVEEDYIDKERREEVLKAVFRLPEDERAMLVMKDYENMSVKEIARIFDLPEGTVKSRLYRSREKVVGYLKERGVINEE